MLSNIKNPKVLPECPLSQYVTSVVGLQKKLSVIAISEKEVAESLGRAAAALRSMAALNHRPTT